MFVLSFSEAYTLWRAIFIGTLNNSIVTKTFLNCNAHAHHSHFAGTCWESQTNLLKYIVMLFRKAKSFSVGYRFPRLSPKACFPWWFCRVSSPRSLLPFGCQNVVGRASVIKWFWKKFCSAEVWRLFAKRKRKYKFKGKAAARLENWNRVVILLSAVHKGRFCEYGNSVLTTRKNYNQQKCVTQQH